MPGTAILKNKFNLTTQQDLDDAEADFASLRLREPAQNPIEGDYGVRRCLAFHRYIFQNLYDRAGEPRKMNIVKEEPALGGLCVEYTNYSDIGKRLAGVLGTMRRAYNAVFSDIGDKSRKQYLEMIIRDGKENGE